MVPNVMVSTPSLNCVCYVCIIATHCTNGDLRLVGGYMDHEGRVEVCISGYWRTVCNNNFDDGDTLVVCRQLFGDDISMYTFCVQCVRACCYIYLD